MARSDLLLSTILGEEIDVYLGKKLAEFSDENGHVLVTYCHDCKSLMTKTTAYDANGNEIVVWRCNCDKNKVKADLLEAIKVIRKDQRVFEDDTFEYDLFRVMTSHGRVQFGIDDSYYGDYSRLEWMFNYVGGWWVCDLDAPTGFRFVPRDEWMAMYNAYIANHKLEG